MTSGDCPRSNHADLSTGQMADLPAIRELVDAYADRADRRDAAGQMALFTEATEYLVYGNRDLSIAQHICGGQTSRQCLTISKSTTPLCISMIRAL